MGEGQKHIISDWKWLHNDVISPILRHSMAVLHYGISTLSSRRQHPCCWRLQSMAHLLPPKASHSLKRFIIIFFYLGFLENALHHVTHSLCFVQPLCYTKSSKTVEQPALPHGVLLSPQQDKQSLVLGCCWPQSRFRWTLMCSAGQNNTGSCETNTCN